MEIKITKMTAGHYDYRIEVTAPKCALSFAEFINGDEQAVDAAISRQVRAAREYLQARDMVASGLY